MRKAALFITICLFLCSIPIFAAKTDYPEKSGLYNRFSAEAGKKNTSAGSSEKLPDSLLKALEKGDRTSGTPGSNDSDSIKEIIDDFEPDDPEEKSITKFLVSAYGIEGSGTSIFTFLSTKELPDEDVQFRLEEWTASGILNESQNEYISPEKYSDYMNKNKITVKYLFLIDRSTSMPPYAPDVKAYISAILEQDEKNGIDAMYSVAGFGEKTEMIKSNLIDPEAVLHTVDSIIYNEEETNLYEGVVNALKMIGSHPFQPGSVTNLILITDGVPYLESGRDAEQLGKKAEKMIAESPWAIVHTLCLDEWQENANKYLCKGTGCQHELKLHRTGTESVKESDLKKASRSGAKIPDFLHNLSVCIYNDDFFRRGDLLNLCIDYKYKIYFEGTDKVKERGSGKSNFLNNVSILTPAD